MTDQSLGSRLRRPDTSKPSTKPIQKGIKQPKNAIELWWVSELMLPNRSCFELFWVHEWIPGSVAKTRPVAQSFKSWERRLQTLIVVSFIPNFYLLRTGVTIWKTPWFVSTQNSRVKRLTDQCLMKHEAEIKLTTSWANCSKPNSSTLPLKEILLGQYEFWLSWGNRYAGITSLYWKVTSPQGPNVINYW